MRLVASRKGGGEGRLQKLEMIFFAAETSTRDDFCRRIVRDRSKRSLLAFLAIVLLSRTIKSMSQKDGWRDVI